MVSSLDWIVEEKIRCCRVVDLPLIQGLQMHVYIIFVGLCTQRYENKSLYLLNPCSEITLLSLVYFVLSSQWQWASNKYA